MEQKKSYARREKDKRHLNKRKQQTARKRKTDGE